MNIFKLLQDFNDHYATAISAFTPFVIGIASFIYLRIYKEGQLKANSQIYISSKFWNFGSNPRIDTVKRFKLTEDKKNYEELETLHTPETWNKHIEMKKNLFTTEIKALDPKAILIVTLKRNPYENWKIIYFNR